MAEFTGRFGLEMPKPDDNYDIEAHARNLEKLSNAAKSVEIAELKSVTQTDFAAAEKKSDTLYFVKGSNDFTMYLGDKPLKGGSAPASASYATTALNGTVHDATLKEVTT